MNPILQFLNQQSPQNGVFNIISQIRSANNPWDMLQFMMPNNPELQQVMNYINKHNGDAKSAFYTLAQEKNVDPNTILSQL